MEIIKNTRDIYNRQKIIDKANEGCNICPCCGEARPWFEATPAIGESAGIMKLMVVERRYKHWYSATMEERNLFRCESCGAEWAGDWYDYE